MSVADRSSWARPDVEELGGGVYRIPLPLPLDGLRAVNVYALADAHGVSLIDAGMAVRVDREGLGSALRGLGFGFGDIRAFYVTHFHRDHYPLAVDIRRTYVTPVWLGEEERHNVEMIRKVANQEAPSAMETQLRSVGGGELIAEFAAVRLNHEDGNRQYESPDGWLTDGMRLELPGRLLNVIATPGHTRGHVVFRDAGAGLLFAGDHILPQITPSIGFEPAPTGRALSDYLMSLARVRALPDSTLLPAHGPVALSAHQRIDELLAHHEERLADALAICDSAQLSALDVARELTWTRRRRSFQTLAPFDKALAVSETDAHLRVLAARHELRGEFGLDGVYRYRAGAAEEGR